MDIEEALLAHRTVMLTGPLTEDLYARIARELLALDEDAPGEPIRLWINSGGGSVYELLALVDMFRLLHSPVETIGLNCFSAAGVLLAAGEPGRRFCTPNATVMLHRSEINASPGRGAELASLGAHYEEIDRRIAGILSEVTGKPLRRIERDRARGLWLDAPGAVAYGLADDVLEGGALT